MFTESIRSSIAISILLLASSVYSASDYSLSFNGSSDFVDCNLSPSLQVQNEFTIEAWVWTGPLPDNAMWSIMSTQNDATTSGIGFFIDGRTNPDSQTAPKRHIHFQIGDGSWHVSNANAAVPEQQWVHLAITRKANEVANIYYNGVPVSVSSVAWNGAITYHANWFIGKQSDVSRYFLGLIDRVSIWNRALTQNEIQNIMFIEPGAGTPNLMGLWDFEEGGGATATDVSGNGNVGTITGAVFTATDFGSSIQPDLMVRPFDQMEFSGGGIYDDLDAQTVAYSIPANQYAEFDAVLQNKRSGPDRFAITADGSDSCWTVQYINAQDGTDLTGSFVTGTTSPIIAGGGSVAYKIRIIPCPAAAPDSSKTLVLSAASLSDPAKTDTFRIVTTITVGKSPRAELYTSNADFAKGTLQGVECISVPDQLQIGTFSPIMPYIWVPNSNQATVSKIDSRTGRELARYVVCPQTNANPSRTTVDLEGNCWVANRQTGTVVKIALLEAGTALDRNANGEIDTSTDSNGDGIITSDEMLPWGQDECVLFEVVVIPGLERTVRPGEFSAYVNDYWNPGPRGLALDSSNNLWIGTYGSKKFYYLDGSTGQITKMIDVSSVNHTSYGAVIDKYGTIWSSGQDKNHVLRLNPTDNSYSVIPVGHYVYGLGIDKNDHLFITGWQSSKLSRIDIVSGTVEWTKDSAYGTKGVAVTNDGDVWVACALGNSILRYSNDGVLTNTIASVGTEPTGIAIDAAEKVWFVDNGDSYIKRIDPATNTIDLAKSISGTTHYGYSDMTGMIARTYTTRLGTWQIIHDSLNPDTNWGIVDWNSSEFPGTSLRVKARSSPDQTLWSTWEEVTKGFALNGTPAGRYLQVQATLQALTGPVSPVLYDLGIGFIPFGDLNRDGLVNLVDFSLFAASWLESGLW